MSGCLYTGDYDMSDDNKFFTLIESYENRLNKGFSNKSIEDYENFLCANPKEKSIFFLRF